jgi:hypothetical protein
MGYRLREIAPDRSLCQELSLDALYFVVPLGTIESVLADTGTHAERERKLNMVAVVLLVIVMNLYTHRSIGHVMEKLIQGLRFIWPTDDLTAPTAAALSYRRYQLGARPLAQLFRRICRPLARPETPGAFLFGLRLMAIDGTTEMVPDTPENTRAFGRYSNGRGQGAYPQVQGMYLIECGTHAIVDAGFWPCHHSEREGCRRLLRSVGPGMLLLWDRGLHDADLISAVQARGAHVLGRLPAHVKPRWVRKLPDGSYLARLIVSAPQRHQRAQSILVRVIVYTVTDPARPGYGEIHRLITTLRSPTTAPAVDLVCAYHERWEIELVIDELATHQQLAGRPLRSLKPLGVMQELYGLLIAHYAIRFLMHEAAMQAQIDPDRLSFVHAVRVVQDAIPEFQMIGADQVPRRYQRLLQDLAATPLLPRRERINPRVVKRKQSKFDVKRVEHLHGPKLIGRFREAVALQAETRARHDGPPRLLHPSKSSVWSRLPEPAYA